MKRTIYFALIFCIGAIAVNAQTFEGKVVYKNSFKSPGGADMEAQLKSAFGETQEYYVKGGVYKSVTNGTFVQYQVYEKGSNKLYSKFTPFDTLYWNDVTSDADPIVQFSVKKDQQEEILGVKCHALVVETKQGKMTYYVSEKYKLDAKAYKEHHLGNWDLVAAAGLPLKSIVETPQFTLTSVATEIKEEKLDDSVFVLPKDIPTKKSPF